MSKPCCCVLGVLTALPSGCATRLGLSEALLGAVFAEMCKDYPHITLMSLCKHTAALLLLNYHLLPLMASQNNCTLSFYALI